MTTPDDGANASPAPKKGNKFAPAYIVETICVFAVSYLLLFALEYVSVVPRLLPAEVRYFFPGLPMVPSEESSSLISVWYNAIPLAVAALLTLLWVLLMSPAPKPVPGSTKAP